MKKSKVNKVERLIDALLYQVAYGSYRWEVAELLMQRAATVTRKLLKQNQKLKRDPRASSIN